jgi:hypothetical protein
MNLDGQPHLYRPPMVWLNGVNQPGLLLVWIRAGQSPQWQAIVTWIRVTGSGNVRYERLTPIVAAAGLRSMEDPQAYRNVPRLRLTAGGILEPIPPAETPTAETIRNEPPPGLVV